MNVHSDAIKALRDKVVVLARRFIELCRRFLVWISPPPRLCATALGLAFVISLSCWIFSDHNFDAVLFFPQARGSALRGESRSLPRTGSTEARAALIASEYLLGPIDQNLKPGIVGDVRVESALYWRGCVYVNLSEDAALEDPAELKQGLAALRKSLSLGLPQVHRFVITIGGVEPYKDGIVSAPGGKK